MSIDRLYSDTIFFLGAGASVDAGFVDVVRLKDEFLKWLENESKKDVLSISTEILATLKHWKDRATDLTNDVDIEILLEAAEKIENKNEDPLTGFYESNILKLERNPVYSSIINKRILSKEIKTFIKKYFNQTDIQTEYLQHLKDFLEPDKSLQIFSTNYDICIEQFCKKSGIGFVDTFDPKIRTKKWIQ
ncbi:MAG: hypothetical protein WBQ25_05030 [Nitrososphaeraceae archaeon]